MGLTNKPKPDYAAADFYATSGASRDILDLTAEQWRYVIDEAMRLEQDQIDPPNPRLVWLHELRERVANADANTLLLWRGRCLDRWSKQTN